MYLLVIFLSIQMDFIKLRDAVFFFQGGHDAHGVLDKTMTHRNSRMDDAEIPPHLWQSAGDDEQVKSRTGSASGCVLTTRASGRSITH